MKSINQWTGSYRGFQLGWIAGPYGYKAAWRSSLCDDWTIGCIYVDTICETVLLAHECIDFNCAREAEELSLGRKLEINELAAFNKARRSDP